MGRKHRVALEMSSGILFIGSLLRFWYKDSQDKDYKPRVTTWSTNSRKGTFSLSRPSTARQSTAVSAYRDRYQPSEEPVANNNDKCLKV